MFKRVLYSEIDLEGDIYEIDESAEKSRKSEVMYKYRSMVITRNDTNFTCIQLSHNDPVYTINLIELIRRTLNEPSISVLVNQVDPTILDQVKGLL